jgi:hypothetical protein
MRSVSDACFATNPAAPELSAFLIALGFVCIESMITCASGATGIGGGRLPARTE